MSKRHGVFTENFTIFFFSNAGKNENEPELNLRDFRRKSLEDYIDVTFILHIVTTRVSKFTQHKFGIEI